MEKATWLSVSFALLDALTYTVYNWDTWRGKTKPQNWLLWLLWMYLAILNAWSYLLSSHDPIKTILAWENAAMTVITFITIFYHGKIVTQDIPTSKKFTALLCVVAGIVFFTFRNGEYANFILQAGTATSMLTVFGDLKKNPKLEPSLPWGMWTGIYAALVGLVLLRWQGKWADLVYPLNYLVLHAAVFILTLRKLDPTTVTVTIPSAPVSHS